MPIVNCLEDLGVHVCNPCANTTQREFGRVRSSGFIFKEYLAAVLAAPSSKAVWDTGILDGKIIVIPETGGSYDPGTPSELRGYGNRPVTYGPRSMTLTVLDPNLIDNYGFYNSLGNQNELVPFFLTSSQIRIFDSPASIIASDPVEDNLETEVIWNVSARVVSTNLPAMFPIGALASTIFTCSYLNDLKGGGTVLSISTQPTGGNVTPGGSISLFVAATGGTGAKAYQWKKDGIAIPGATTAAFTKANASASDAGVYTVDVTAGGVTVTSTAATISVNAAGTYNTELDFTTGGIQTHAPSGMTVNLGAASTVAKFRFNSILTVTLPDSLTGRLYNSSTEVGGIDTRQDYKNQPFQVVLLDGTVRNGIFKDVSEGNIVLTS